MNKVTLFTDFDKNETVESEQSIYKSDNYITRFDFLCEHPKNKNYSIWLDTSLQEPIRIYNAHISEKFFQSKAECLKYKIEITQNTLTHLKQQLENEH